MGSVELSHVSFGYGSDAWLLRDVSLRFDAGISAVVGENGAGKSTLLKLLSGELKPEQGTIRRLPAEGIAVSCEQGVETLTDEIRAFVRSGDAQACRMRALLNVQEHQVARFASLSPGERRRLQLGAALSMEPDVLLLDEPTNHVDAPTRALVMEALSRFRGVCVLVSHDRDLIDALARQTVRLHQGTARTVMGGYTHAQQVWSEEEEERARTREALARQTRRAEEKLREAQREQAATSRGRSAKALMKNPRDRDGRSMGRKNLAAWAEAHASRSVAVQRKQTETLRQDLARMRVEKACGSKIFARYEPCPRPVLTSFVNRALRRDGVTLLQDLTLTVRRQDRIRIVGDNGAGKSSLLGELHQAVGAPERVLHLPQELTRAQIRSLHERTLALPREDKGRVLEVVAALGVDPSRLLATTAPSPGEARKLLIAHGLGRGAWALLLDEPTHHLDLPSVERLEHALREYPGALLVVTHDRTFLRDALTTTWCVSHRTVREIPA